MNLFLVSNTVLWIILLGDVFVTRIDKRFERILNNPKDIKWSELQTVLKKFGLLCEKPNGGSHWTVHDERSETNITVPVYNNRVKAVYMKKLIALIKELREEK
jgi:RNA recognition motif-containing protein